MKRMNVLALSALLICTLAAGSVLCSAEDEDGFDAFSMQPAIASNKAHEDDYPAEPMTFEDFRNAEDGAPVHLDTYVQDCFAGSGGRVSVYAQDPEGACFIRDASCTPKIAGRLVPGTRIRVLGVKEGSDVADGSVTLDENESDSFLAEPEDVSSLVGTDGLETHVNKKVSFRGFTVEASGSGSEEVPFLYLKDGTGTQGDDLYFSASLNGNSCTFCVNSAFCGEDSDVYQAVQGLSVGDTVDLEGYLVFDEGEPAPQICSISVA